MIAVTLPGSEILDFRSPEIPPRQDECFGLPDRSRGDPTRLPAAGIRRACVWDRLEKSGPSRQAIVGWLRDRRHRPRPEGRCLKAMPKISRLLCLSAIRVHYPSAYVIALALILGLIGFGSASAGIPAERQMTITLAELQGELRDGSRGSSCCPCCFLHETSPSRGACSCGLDFDAASVCAEPHLLASRPHFPSHAQAFSSADLTKSSKPPRTRYDSVCNLQAKTQIIRQNDG